MKDMYNTALKMLASGDLNIFNYLRSADTLLSNPVSLNDGRDLVIRALDVREKFSNYELLLRNLVRKSGLYPYLKNEFSDLTLSEQVVLGFYETPYSEEIVFHSMQFQIFELLKNGINVVLSAPTSMGKSAIVDSIIGLGKVQRVVLVVPTIALADETRKRLFERFNTKYQIIHHSSQVANRENVIYVLTQERVNERRDIIDIDLFVIDEFYKLSFQKRVSGDTAYDNERVIELNIALSKLLKNSKQFYMTGPFIKNIIGLSDLGCNHTFITSDFNTVAIDVEPLNIPAKDANSKKQALQKIMKRCDGEATIIYCKSSTVAGSIAKTLISGGFYSEFNSEVLDWVAEEFDFNWDYCEAMRHGIGLHYGGLPRALQQYTINLFNSGMIKILICTSTIIEGVNTVAKNVIIHDNRDGVYSIDKFTHGNIKGRAGRMGVHFVGKVYCLEAIPKDNFNQEVVIPLGIQDDSTPLNLLTGIQPEHLSDYSQNRFDNETSIERFGVELLKRHSAFNIEKFNEMYAFIEMLSSVSLNSLIFHWQPTGPFFQVLATALTRFTPGALTRLRIPTSTNSVIHAKLTSYYYEPDFKTYLNQQINLAKSRVQKGEASDLSSCINDELRIVINIYGHTVPKLLMFMEDVVKLYAKRNNINRKIDYIKTRGVFENYHLPPGLAGMEEMGVPVQTLQKIFKELSTSDEIDVYEIEINENDVNDMDVDEILNFLRGNEVLDVLGRVDRMFIDKALALPKTFMSNESKPENNQH